jgi:hypothetical protein
MVSSKFMFGLLDPMKLTCSEQLFVAVLGSCLVPVRSQVEAWNRNNQTNLSITTSESTVSGPKSRHPGILNLQKVSHRPVDVICQAFRQPKMNLSVPNQGSHLVVDSCSV